MYCSLLDQQNQAEIESLFTAAFGAAEGEQEGKLVGTLAASLAGNIDDQEVLCIGAYESELLIGAIFLTRLQSSAPTRIYMLAPVAVSTACQGKGIGQTLIHYGLEQLRIRSVDVVLTYGDSNFYSRVGFQPVSEQVVPAPFQLSQPEGWLGQSLTESPIPTIDERPSCVAAFNDPAYW